MIKRIVVLESEDPVVAELLSGGERGVRSTVTAFQSLLEEIEESAGDVPLREVGRKASLEAEREAIERVLHPDQLEPQAGRPPAPRELQDAAPEDPRVRAQGGRLTAGSSRASRTPEPSPWLVS